MDKDAIKERCNKGRDHARRALSETGKTHRGKHGLGRRPVEQGAEIAAWRQANNASINGTATQFGISAATVKRYCARATAARAQWEAVYAEVAKIDKETERVTRELAYAQSLINF